MKYILFFFLPGIACLILGLSDCCIQAEIIFSFKLNFVIFVTHIFEEKKIITSGYRTEVFNCSNEFNRLPVRNVILKIITVPNFVIYFSRVCEQRFFTIAEYTIYTSMMRFLFIFFFWEI